MNYLRLEAAGKAIKVTLKSDKGKGKFYVRKISVGAGNYIFDVFAKAFVEAVNQGRIVGKDES